MLEIRGSLVKLTFQLFGSSYNNSKIFGPKKFKLNNKEENKIFAKKCQFILFKFSKEIRESKDSRSLD